MPRQRQTARRAVPSGAAARTHRSQGRSKRRKVNEEALEEEEGQIAQDTAVLGNSYASYTPPYTGPRPRPQNQSSFLSKLAAELVDKILGDGVLNERDHLALSGVCTAMRLGYTEEFWNATLKVHTPFSHNQFTYRLLHDPCNTREGCHIHEEKTCLSGAVNTTVHAAGSSNTQGTVPAAAHIWTRAITRINDKSMNPGIDFDGPCYKARHKRCKCMRFMGQGHAKVISNVNIKKTSWGHIFYHYQGLSEYVSHTDFDSESKVNTKGERTEMYCLAQVDAAILNEVGGVWAAGRVRKSEEGKKRKRPPKDRDW
ncbi:hypothetical protein BDP27DRAFT_1354620 [Rhodocollybia butyracea]|uniref:Uncharacterized protein n=1 Tax=Rhodocollybia butyracea TaxID=206335 RepID=A0A9P5TVP4_9AGAR|nr:hypothetical protein BDP27DRAFT_1354620 [Rhodocollybia butyracea]